MPTLPNREARLAQLVRRGILPSVAERVVAEAEAAGQRIPPPNEAAWEGDVSAADQEQAKLWWYYTPDVPQRLRRILDARPVGDAED